VDGDGEEAGVSNKVPTVDSEGLIMHIEPTTHVR